MHKRCTVVANTTHTYSLDLMKKICQFRKLPISYINQWGSQKSAYENIKHRVFFFSARFLIF